MKKIFIITIFIFIFGPTLFPNFSFAQKAAGMANMAGMMGNIAAVSDGHTAREEVEGKAVFEKLQTKELVCKDLSDDNFGTLGEYFMGKMMGNSHEAMNNMIVQMMGAKEEEQMHIVMGKRLSGCDTSAAFSSQSAGFMSMMNMMGGEWSSPSGLNQKNNSMMGNFGSNLMGWGFGFFGGLFMILWWVLIIAGIVFFIKWLSGQFHDSHSHKREKTSLEILKERYAKGEIDKKEFEEKKKDLTA